MSVDRRVMKVAVLLAMLAVGAILYFAAVAFIPVALALFFALLLSSAVDSGSDFGSAAARGAESRR